MQRILITGGAGFIGSQFVRQALRGEDCHALVLDSLTYAGHPENLPEHPRLRLCVGDIADDALVGRLLAEFIPDAIVHFAAETHVDRSIGQPHLFAATNVMGTLAMLEATRHWWTRLPASRRSGFRWLQVSTDEVFGSIEAPLVASETAPYLPNSPYAASKAAGDHLVRSYHRTYGLPTIIARCCNNYGPRQFPEKLIPLMIGKALADEPLPVYGNGQQTREWVHVTDQCQGLWLALRHLAAGECVNLGGREALTNLAVVEQICLAVDAMRGRPVGSTAANLVQHVADRPGHDQRYAMDSTRAHQQLGWWPAVDFSAGLAETIAWYMAHQAWADAVRERTRYHGQRLGLIDSELQ